jgi:hypothetical protein
MTRQVLAVWAYFAELLLTFLLWLGLVTVVPNFNIADFTIATSGALSLISGLLFAGSFAVFVAFYQQSGTEFGRFLSKKGAFGTYSFALGFPVGVYAASLLLLLIAGYTKVPWIATAAFLLFVYGIVNLYSLLANMSGLMRLHNLFRMKLEQTQASHS